MSAADWPTATEILALGCPALPGSEKGLRQWAERHGWRGDPERARQERGQGRGGGAWRYHPSLLPPETQARLAARRAGAEAPEADGERSAAWARFERLPEAARCRAEARLAVVDQVAELRAGGMRASLAVPLVARRAGVGGGTLWRWLRAVDGLARADWLPALAPAHVGRTETADCDPRAWDFLAADWLRPEQPSFVACYRRMVEAAAEHGWAPVPSAKTLRRRMERLPRGAVTLARGGREAAARSFPHQTRDRSQFAPCQAVNADGHRFDVFVRWPDGAIGRPALVAVQDLASGLILGHRLDRTENWSAVRHAFHDAMESYGIPEEAWLDNGRAFASKWMTGGMKTRFRFKLRDEEPKGLLTALGVKVRWTTPYHGQAKPIERAFLDLCEEIARHPACAGAYTGNSPVAKPANYGSRAIPIEAFRTLVAEEIRRHNTREGRRTATARGRSFAEVYRAGVEAGATIARATPAQLRLLLMAAEGVKALKPTGEVHLGRNRYWAEELVAQTGRRLVLRFDPDDLVAGVSVYTLDGRHICDAACIEATGFADIAAAREQAARKRAWLKAQRECLALERRMSIDEVARLVAAAPVPEPRRAPKVVRPVFGAAVAAAPAYSDEQAERSFAAAVRGLAGEEAVLPFPTPTPTRRDR